MLAFNHRVIYVLFGFILHFSIVSGLRLEPNKVRSWKVPEGPSDFPETTDEKLELSKKLDFGIAISGGSLRAAGNALGYLRALNEKPVDVLKDAKYIAINSGATWVTIIALFAAAAELSSKKLTASEFSTILGQRLEEGPKFLAQSKFLDRLIDNILLTVSSLGLLSAPSPPPTTTSGSDSAKPSSLDLIKPLIAQIMQSRGPPKPVVPVQNAWSEAVKEFLVAHNQVDPPYISFSDNFRDSVAKYFPFLIVAGGLQISKDKNGSPSDSYSLPFEFTPTYCGVPVADQVADSTVPTGFIEPFAFNCDYSQDKRVEVDSTNPKRFFQPRINNVNNELTKISDVSGISSNYLVQKYYESFAMVTGMVADYNLGLSAEVLMQPFVTKYHFWAPKSDGSSLQGGSHVFSDGGAEF